MTVQATISPRVVRVLNLIDRLEEQEKSQLGQLLPLHLPYSLRISDTAVADATTYFYNKAKQRSVQPSLDDPFIESMSYRDYFFLSDKEVDDLWDKLEATAPRLEDLPIVEVSSDAKLPPRQKRRS